MVSTIVSLAMIVVIVGLSIYAYKLALDEGLAEKYKEIPGVWRFLKMMWRGYVMMAALGIFFGGIGVVAIVFAPVLLTARDASQTASQQKLHFFVRIVVFSVFLSGGIIMAYKAEDGYIAVLAWIVAVWAGLGILGTLIRTRPAPERNQFPKLPPESLSEPLACLANCGIGLRAGVSAADLVDSDSNGFLDAKNYDSIIMVMGGWGKSLDEPVFSDDVWYNDIECITEPEDYARVAKHLQRLSKGDFAIENVRAETDEDGAEVALKFTLRGKEYDLWAPLDDDMIEVEVWAELQGLFESCCRDGRRLERIFYGQDGCYFYITPEQKSCLQKLGLVFFT